MAKKNKKNIGIELKEEKSSSIIENKAPVRQYPNFEAFWSANVKNGKEIHLKSCKAHLQALGTLGDPDKWAESIKHFGIVVED
jgi:hypothetical protein